MKRLILFFGIACQVLLLSTAGYGQLTINTVVIDAGHGGHDPGAMGRHSREKDITLAVALKTGNYIRQNMTDVKVIFTRTSDMFVELYKRAQIANDNRADLFISIHCNSNRSSSPYGTETYVMGLHKTQENLEVAKKENSAILQEKNYADMYEGFDPNSDEDYVTLSLFQHAFQEQSIDMAIKIQDQFRDRAKRVDRGVKQAGFLVLYRTTMPGILIETGFLSNPPEEQFLLSDQGQDYIASAIYRAFREFKNEYEKANQLPQPLVKQSDTPASHDDLSFRVQFASFSKPKSRDYKKFRGIKDVREYYHDGLYKYTAGDEKNPDDADALKKQLIGRGYKDVFIVAFLNGQRISMEEALKLLNQSK